MEKVYILCERIEDEQENYQETNIIKVSYTTLPFKKYFSDWVERVRLDFKKDFDEDFTIDVNYDRLTARFYTEMDYDNLYKCLYVVEKEII